MANSTRRLTFDDDPSSSQNLWIMVLVVAAMVLSFLFGKFFIGDRIRGPGTDSQAALPASPAVTVAPPTPMAAVPTPGIAADGAVTITPGTLAPPAPAGAVSPPTGLDGAITSGTPAPLPAAPSAAAPSGLVASGAAARERSAREKQQEEEARAKAEADARQRAADARRKAADKNHDKPDKPAPKRTAERPATTRTTPRPAPAPPAAEKPKPKPAEPAKPAVAADAGPIYRVRAGTYTHAEDAAAQQKKLAAQHVDTFIRLRRSAGHQVYDVQVGAYQDKDNARKTVDELKAKGVDAELVD